MTNTKKEYVERHRNWQDKAIEQLSVTNNFLLAISTGLFAFLFDKAVFSQLEFCFCIRNLDPKLTLYGASLFFALLAIATGIIVLISRLYDFRLTRHITLIRQRFSEKNQGSITEQNKYAATLSGEDFPYPTIWQRITAIRKVLWGKIDFLTKNEMSTNKANFPKQKFKELRLLAYRLGIVSWLWTKYQALLFLLTTILYACYLWAK